MKTVAVKLHHGKSRRKPKSVVVREKVATATTESTGCSNGERVGHEVRFYSSKVLLDALRRLAFRSAGTQERFTQVMNKYIGS